MATFASDLLPDLDDIRGIAGELGLHPYTATLISGVWSGSHTGDGTVTETATDLKCGGQDPHLRWVNDEEIALGQLHRGDAMLGPVTPPYVGGGVDPLDFGEQLNNGETLHVLLAGPSHPHGALYRVKHAHQEGALSYVLTLSPVLEQVA